MKQFRSGNGAELGAVSLLLTEPRQIVSQFHLRRFPLAQSGSYVAPVDAQTAAEVDRIVRSFATQGPTEEELVSVRDREVFASAAAFQTAADTARDWSWPLAYGQPDDVLLKQPQRYAALTRE